MNVHFFRHGAAISNDPRLTEAEIADSEKNGSWTRFRRATTAASKRDWLARSWRTLCMQ